MNDHPLFRSKADFRAALMAGDGAWSDHAQSTPEALHGCELAEADLTGRNLAELDFSHADFFRATLVDANFKKSKFRNADLSEARMERVALYKADFRDAIILEANLSGADLSATDCRGADFRGANLQGVNFTDADLRGCNFSYCDLSGADMTRANITGAKFHFAQLAGANVTHINYGHYREMIGFFYGVRGVDATYGNALFVRDAKDQDYIDTLLQAILDKPDGFVKSLDMFLFRAWGLIDHGRSLVKVAFYATIIATFYGLIYLADMVYGWGIMDYSSSAKTWFTPFYYSVVTYTTLGFGDVTADSLFGEMLVISEVIVGYFTLGLLLAILANTIARRS